MRRQRFGFSGKFSAFVIPVALVIPSARIASITGKRSAVLDAAFACRDAAAFCRPNSAFFKASMSQSDPFDLSCMGVTAEAERRRAGTGAREEVMFARDSPLEEGVLSEVRRGLRVRLLARNPASTSMVCEPIPYASEQGIYFGLAGN